MFLMVVLLFIRLNGKRKEHTCKVWKQLYYLDGYNKGPSIKDHEHQIRVKKACADDTQLRETMKGPLTLHLPSEKHKQLSLCQHLQ